MNITTIILIPGLWATALCWEHWVKHYSEKGYSVIAANWPGLDGDIEQLRCDPSRFATLGLTEVVDHFEQIIRRFEPANDLLVMIDNFRQSKSCEPAWITPKLLDVAVQAGPVGGDDAVPFFRVMFDPVLPTERRRPKAGDKNNRGDVHRENAPERARFSTGKSSGGRKLNAARLLMSSGLCLSLDSLTTDRKIRR